MNDEQFLIKKDVNKTKYIVIISVASVLFFFLFPVLLLGGFFDNPPSKSKVVLTVKNNKERFESAIEYIKTLDKDSFNIEYKNHKLYDYMAGRDDVTQINDKELEEVFKLGIQDIYINDNTVDFFCGGAGRDYYTGIFYSYEGTPVGFEGDTSMILTKEVNGWQWKEENGDNHYYCEKIEGNWYYYQMWY